MEIIKDLEEFESNKYLLESCDHDDEVFDGGFICGKEEGLEQGLEQGREEEKINTIKNMHRLGIDLEIISKSVQVSLKKIQKILGLF